MTRVEKWSDEELLKHHFNSTTGGGRHEIVRRGYGLNWLGMSMFEVYDVETDDLIYVVTAEGVERA